MGHVQSAERRTLENANANTCFKIVQRRRLSVGVAQITSHTQIFRKIKENGRNCGKCGKMPKRSYKMLEKSIKIKFKLH